MERQRRRSAVLGGVAHAELGRFRKRDGLDCGRARCGQCHGDKLLGAGRRVNERRAAIADQAAWS